MDKTLLDQTPENIDKPAPSPMPPPSTPESGSGSNSQPASEKAPSTPKSDQGMCAQLHFFFHFNQIMSFL